MQEPGRWLYNLAIPPKGDTVAAAAGTSNTCVWRLSDGQRLANFRAVSEDVYMIGPSLRYTPNGQTLLACVNEGYWESTKSPPTTRLALYETGKYTHRTTWNLSAGAAGVAVSPDGKWIVTTHWASLTVACWDAKTGRFAWSVKSEHGKTDCPSISPDGKVLAVGTQSGAIMVLDLATGKVLGSPLRHGQQGASPLAFSPDGKLIASGGEDGRVKLWSVADRRELAVLTGHKRSLWGAAFSPDGNLLATAGGAQALEKEPWRWQGEVKLWDVESRRPIREFVSHSPCAFCALFLPNGKTLVTSGRDGKIRLWDVEELATSRK